MKLHTSLDTNSFIQALRRLTARRGDMKKYAQTMALVGAEQELLRSLSEIDHKKMENFLQDHGGD